STLERGSPRLWRPPMSSKHGIAGTLFTLCALSPNFADAAATTLAATQSAWIDASSPTQNKGTDSNLRVKASGPVKRALVKFDVSQIPACAPVVSADLQLYVTDRSSVTASRRYDAHRVDESWVEGSGSTNGVSWSRRDGVLSWAAAGGTFGAIPTASTLTGTAASVVLHWNVTADVAAWVAGTTPNHGWVIKDSQEGSGSAEFRFASDENGT